MNYDPSMLDSVHHTRNEDVAVYSWERVPDEMFEVSSPALIDTRVTLGNGKPAFARIDYTQSVDIAPLWGVEFASFEDLMILRAKARFQLQPYLGTPRAENALRHSIAHDLNMWRQLDRENWIPGRGAVYGAGKNWRGKRAGQWPPADKSALVGWDKDGGGPGQLLWQPDAIAHNRFHFDDGTTVIYVRRIGIISQVLIDPVREVAEVVKDSIDGGSS